MSDRKLRTAALDRLIRVRRVRARLEMAALGRVQARQLAELGLRDRVASLLAAGGADVGAVGAGAASARARADAMLGGLADDLGRRLADTGDERRRLAEALGRARAAVDAAMARRAERERGG